MEDLSDAGTINYVSLYVYARRGSGGSGNVLKIGINSGGTESLSGDITTLTTSYALYGGPSIQSEWTTDPATNLAWKEAGVNALQAVIKRISGNRDTYVTQVYFKVSYIRISTWIGTPTPTKTPMITPIPTDTPTITSTPTRTPTIAPTPTQTPIQTPTSIFTTIPTATPTKMPTLTPTFEPTVTVIPGEVSVPKGLKATAGADSIKLKWAPNPESFLKGYNVYRKGQLDISFIDKLNADPVQGTDYIDQGLAFGELWYYRITAVDISGGESPMTNPVWAKAGSLRMWISDYRGKPGDDVSLRVNIENCQGIAAEKGINIDITYDPGMIICTGLEKTAITNDLYVVLDSAEGGHVRISALGAPGSKLRGEGHMFDLKFRVSGSASYGAQSRNSFNVVEMYDSLGRLLNIDYGDEATFTVAADYIRGDINGDGAVSTSDAALAMQTSLGDMQPERPQMNAGDMNGDGEIDSADVVSIMRLAGGLPVNPLENNLTPGRTGMSPGGQHTIALPEITASPGGSVTVPLEAINADGSYGADIYVNYDPAVLTPLDVVPTAFTQSCGMRFIIMQEGVLRITLGQDKELPGASEKLLEMKAEIRAGIEEGVQTRLKLAYVKLCGQYGEDISWWEDVNTVDGVVTISSAAPPRPTPVITARLWTDKAVYSSGDVHMLYYSLEPNVPEDLLASIKADFYLLLVTPGGKMLWYDGGNKRRNRFSSKVAPAFRYPNVSYGIAGFFRDGDGSISRKEGLILKMPLGQYPQGIYTWYAVVVLSGSSPFNASYYLSNIANAEFEIIW